MKYIFVFLSLLLVISGCSNQTDTYKTKTVSNIKELRKLLAEAAVIDKIAGSELPTSWNSAVEVWKEKAEKLIKKSQVVTVPEEYEDIHEYYTLSFKYTSDLIEHLKLNTLTVAKVDMKSINTTTQTFLNKLELKEIK